MKGSQGGGAGMTATYCWKAG